MTDRPPPSCGHEHPRDVCGHVSGPDSPCCNLDCFPCPQHFSTLISAGLIQLAVNEKREAAATMSHLVKHNWLIPAVMTWAGLIRRYAPRDGQSADEAIAAIDPGIPDGIPEDEIERQRPWMFRLGVIVRSAIAGDAETIMDTLMSARGDPAMGPHALLSLLSSIALAAHDAVAQHPIDYGILAGFHIIGSQTMNAPGFGLLDTLVTIVDSARGGNAELPPQVVARMNEATPDELLSALGMAGRALGQIIDPEGHTGTGPIIVATDHDHGMGIVDWRDRSLDPGRDREEMCPVRALRVAYAFARSEVDEVSAMVRQAEDSVQFCMDVVVGACSMIGLEVGSKQATDA